jgi:hypothetical protein
LLKYLVLKRENPKVVMFGMNFQYILETRRLPLIRTGNKGAEMHFLIQLVQIRAATEMVEDVLQKVSINSNKCIFSCPSW